MKKIPLIIPVFNQSTYLQNIVLWWRWYHPDTDMYPIFIVDNSSTSIQNDEYYHYVDTRLRGVRVVRYRHNDFISNVSSFIETQIKENYEYYVISDPDISIHPATPPNFLKIFQYIIETGYHRAGFGLAKDNMPEWMTDRENILYNEGELLHDPKIFTFESKEYKGYRAPIDTTMCMYSTKNTGWYPRMNGEDWANCIRIFEAFHLPWYLHPEHINSEMDYYFLTCKKFTPGQASSGLNNNRPKQYDNDKLL